MLAGKLYHSIGPLQAEDDASPGFAQLYVHDPAEFPAVAALSGAPDFEVPAGVLRTMVTWTVFAASRENTRYAINGILWERRKDQLTMVATDGRRLGCGWIGECEA